MALRTQTDSIPSAARYLASDPDKRASWKFKLGNCNKPRIGIAWSGGEQHKNDKNRSMALAELMRHMPTEYTYVSLQKEIRDRDKAALNEFNIEHFEDEIGDFSDTAALCDLIELVISVNTSVAHLSGALGKSVCLLLPFVPDWRWLMERQDNPWYPSMKIYRQDSTRRWKLPSSIIEDNLKYLTDSGAISTISSASKSRSIMWDRLNAALRCHLIAGRNLMEL